jgi:hypothetical protein
VHPFVLAPLSLLAADSEAAAGKAVYSRRQAFMLSSRLCVFRNSALGRARNDAEIPLVLARSDLEQLRPSWTSFVAPHDSIPGSPVKRSWLAFAA